MLSENRNYDGRTREALRRIREVYSDKCESVGNVFLQHGRNAPLDAPAGVWEQVWHPGDLESLPSTNAIDTVSCSRAGATQDIQVSGMVVSAGAFTRVTQVVTLDGLTPKTLATPLARVESIINIGPSTLPGWVSIRRQGDGILQLSNGGGLPATGAGSITTNVIGGLVAWPSEGYCEIRDAAGDLREIVWYSSRTDESLTVLASGRAKAGTLQSAGLVTDTMLPTLFSGLILIGSNRSLKAAYTTAENEYLAITQIVLSAVHLAVTVGVKPQLEVREPGGVWKPVVGVLRSDWPQPHAALEFDPALIIPPNNDIRVLVLAQKSSIAVDVWLNGLILTKVE